MKKNIKKILIILMMLLMSMTLISCNNANVTSKETNKSEIIEKEEGNALSLDKLAGEVDTLSQYKLPKEGEVINGFKVKGIYDFYEKKAKIVEFEHEMTGAKCMLISNDDVDKSFSLGFNTFSMDDKGLPHIFEHATVDCSEKYPYPGIFNKIGGKTYLTYMNAETEEEVTFYPVSSLSEKQLFALYKFYTDGIFKPLILFDKKIFDKEGARYVLYDKDDDIKVSGAVYNEMKGYFYDINNARFLNIKRALYEGGHIGTEFGGEFYKVIDVTHDDLINFHDRYYHPSNMLMFLYGDIDYKKYLEYIDNEYLKDYVKVDMQLDPIDYKKNEEFKKVRYDFPVSKGGRTEHDCVFEYGIRLEDITSYESGLFDVVNAALVQENSPLKLNIKNKIPNANISIKYYSDFSVPFLRISVTSVDEKDEDVIKECIEKGIQEFVEKGIDKETIDMYVDGNMLAKEFRRDSHGFAINSSYMLKMYHLSFRDKNEEGLGYLLYTKGHEEISERYEDGTIDNLMQKYLKDRKDAVMLSFVPSDGLLDEIEEREYQKLVDLKNSMSDEEIDDMIKDNEEYNKWLTKSTTGYDISDFVVENVKDLESYKNDAVADDYEKENIRFITSDMDDIIYNDIKILFDMSGEKYEDLLKDSLLLSILEKFPTKKHTREDFSAEIIKNCYSYNKNWYINNYFGTNEYKPYIAFSIMSLDKNYDKAMDLLRERLFETDFSDINVIKNEVPSILNNIRTMISSDPVNIPISYIEGMFHNATRFSDHVGYADYMHYLEEVSKMSDEELETLLLKFEEKLKFILNKSNMICEIISNDAMSEKIENDIIGLSNNFTDEERVEVNHNEGFNKRKNKTGIVMDIGSNYNVVGIDMSTSKYKYDGKMTVLSSIIDDIVYEEYRSKRGAYGAYSYFNMISSSIYTYNDPNVGKSYDVYNELPKIFDSFDLNEDNLETYKLNAYAYLSYPLTNYSAASVAINEVLSKTSEKRAERYGRYMQEIKDTTIEDIKSFSGFIKDLCNGGIYASAGNEPQIKSDEKYFDEISYEYVTAR